MAMAAARLRLGSLLPRARALCAEAKPTYTERMDATGRPVSPHLMIYRLPTIAYSSITVRISGIIAGAGVLGAGVVSLYGSETAQNTMISVGNVVGRFYYDFAILSPTAAAVLAGCVAAVMLLCALGIWLAVASRQRSARGRKRKGE